MDCLSIRAGCANLLEMAPFYKYLCDASFSDWEFDAALHEQFKVDNEASLRELEVKLEDAKANLGASDVFEILIEKALFLVRILDKVLSMGCMDVSNESIIG
jgi:hypothetical protein